MGIASSYMVQQQKTGALVFFSQEQLEKTHCLAVVLVSLAPERSTHTALCCLPLIKQALVSEPPVWRSTLKFCKYS